MTERERFEAWADAQQLGPFRREIAWSGWQAAKTDCAPREPTEAMQHAGAVEFFDDRPGIKLPEQWKLMRKVWRAMYDAWRASAPSREWDAKP